MNKSKEQLRNQIDVIDEQIASLLQSRFTLAKAIGKLKKDRALPVKDASREEEVLLKVSAFMQEDDEKQAVLQIYKSIIKECSNLQKQGYRLIIALF